MVLFQINQHVIRNKTTVIVVISFVSLSINECFNSPFSCRRIRACPPYLGGRTSEERDEKQDTGALISNWTPSFS